MMNHGRTLEALADRPTRRQAIAGVAIALGSLAWVRLTPGGNRGRDFSYMRVHSPGAYFHSKP